MKKHGICRWTCSVLAVLSLLFCVGITAQAAAPDLTRTGSITVEMKDPKTQEVVSGGQMVLFRVGSIETKNANYSFVPTETFAGSGLSLSDVGSAELAQALAAYAEENALSGTQQAIGTDGSVTYNGLQLGLYLLVQAKAADGYDAVKPFLVSLPLLDDGAYLYDVDAAPKLDVVRLTDITVRKVWNDSQESNRPDSVTVELLRGDVVFDTAVLSELNGWSHTWKDLPETDLYSVQEADVPKGYSASYKQDGFNFTVTNTSSLIQTGQLLWPIPVLIVSGILLLVIGCILFYKRKRDYA